MSTFDSIQCSTHGTLHAWVSNFEVELCARILPLIQFSSICVTKATDFTGYQLGNVKGWSSPIISSEFEICGRCFLL